MLLNKLLIEEPNGNRREYNRYSKRNEGSAAQGVLRAINKIKRNNHKCAVFDVVASQCDRRGIVLVVQSDSLIIKVERHDSFAEEGSAQDESFLSRD